MKAISIYALTRNQNMECVQKLERQLSGRDFFLRIKEWELESMKALVKQLELHMEEVYKLRFFLFRFRSRSLERSSIFFRSKMTRL